LVAANRGRGPFLGGGYRDKRKQIPFGDDKQEKQMRRLLPQKDSGLAAVEEAGGEEYDGDDQGDAGVDHVVVAQAEEGIGEPCCEAHEPNPRCFSQHLGLSRVGSPPGRSRRGLLALFYTT
jgi:hypothetical protein